MAHPLEIQRMVREIKLRETESAEKYLDAYIRNVEDESERWGERIKLLERRARFAELVLSGHGDYLLPTNETP